MSAQLLTTAIVLSFTVTLGHSAARPICDPWDWSADPDDCSAYWICINGVSYKYVCPEQHVVDFEGRKCVPIGSPADTCTTKSKTAGLQDQCKMGELKAHDENCEKFYECTEEDDGTRKMIPGECPYPLLFDPDLGKCVHYEIAQCGSRHVPVDACEYEANACKNAHCVPCHVRFPSCARLPDGMNAWTGREWSPFYVLCHAQRVLYQGECKQDKMRQVFHPDMKICVEYKDKLFA